MYSLSFSWWDEDGKLRESEIIQFDTDSLDRIIKYGSVSGEFVKIGPIDVSTIPVLNVVIRKLG